MRIRTQCRACGLPFRATLERDTKVLACTSCGEERAVDPAGWEAGPPGRVGPCPICACDHLYGQKDVNRAVGCGLVILGAVGTLQFDVVAYRLQHEYGVISAYDAVEVQTARWVSAEDDKLLQEFRSKNEPRLAIDAGGALAYLAPSRVNLSLTEERWPDITFSATREH